MYDVPPSPYPYPYRYPYLPLPLAQALCGPRTEAGLAEGSVLHRLGYTAEMCVKM